jgi:DNA-directed RNA polymerase sigma subunit (sigma70/sigma32)
MDVAMADLRRVERCKQEADRAREDLFAAIIRARESGETLRDIGKAAGLSHQRIAQILADGRRS